MRESSPIPEKAGHDDVGEHEVEVHGASSPGRSTPEARCLPA